MCEREREREWVWGGWGVGGEGRHTGTRNDYIILSSTVFFHPRWICPVVFWRLYTPRPFHIYLINPIDAFCFFFPSNVSDVCASRYDTVRHYRGHGIGSDFHCAPFVKVRMLSPPSSPPRH